jgi:hypothetical protein
MRFIEFTDFEVEILKEIYQNHSSHFIRRKGKCWRKNKLLYQIVKLQLAKIKLETEWKKKRNIQ